MTRILACFLFLLSFFAISTSTSFASISVHGTSVGSSGGSGSALTLPTLLSNGDFVIASISGDLYSFAEPAYSIGGTGWTSLCNGGWGAHFWKIWHTGDPTTVTFTNLNGASTRNSTSAISYSGVDTSNPVDGFDCTFQYVVGWSTPIFFKAPGVTPQWTNDLLFVSYYWGQGPPSWTPPSGFTTEQYFASCVNCGYILYQDKQLSGAVNTGDINSQAPSGTSASGSNTSIGLSLLLKPASGTSFSPATTVFPTISGLEITTCGGGGTIDYGQSIFPQNWDLVTYVSFGTTGQPSGFSTLTVSSNVSIFYKTWRTGNPTTITCSGFLQFVTLHHNHRFTGSGPFVGQPVSIDTWEKATATAATVTLPSMTLASSNEYLTTWWADFTAGAGFSIPSGLNLDVASPTWCISCTNNSNIEASNQAPANPTGTFSSTNANSSSDSLIGVMVAYKLGAIATRVPHRTLILDQF